MKYKKFKENTLSYKFVCDFCGDSIIQDRVPKNWISMFYKEYSYHICDVCKYDPFVEHFINLLSALSFKDNMINLLEVLEKLKLDEDFIQTPLFTGYLHANYIGKEQFLNKYITKAFVKDSFKRS